jgi:DNA-binding beta-propeller fold protein YncE
VTVDAHRSVLMRLVALGGVPIVEGGGTGGRRSWRVPVAALALSVAGLLVLFTGVTRADAPKLITYGNFATGKVLSYGISVDQPSGELYVASFASQSFSESGHLDKFDAAGNQLPPSPFAGGYESGAAINPTNGDLYVLKGFAGVAIETYNPVSGDLISSFPVPESRNFIGLATLVQIATDAAGDVYLPVVPENEVLEYSPSGTLLNTFTGSGALRGPTGVAVDSSGDVWVADHANNRIEELSPADAPIGEIKSEGVEALALDAQGDVFAIVKNSTDSCGTLRSPCAHLIEYGAAGAQLADVGAGTFGATETNSLPSMVAVNESNGRVYVTDSGKDLVWIFAPPTAPTIDNELAAEVNASEAKLGALVNPGGTPARYRFEYGPTAEYGQTTPFPEGSVGEGVTPSTVWASANGLQPGTTYHYRVVATSELGTVAGADRTFTTETGAQASCPNEPFRGDFSASLPDCRAYEMVTPPNSSSAEPDTKGSAKYFAGGGIQGNHASWNGERIAYRAVEPMPGADSSGYDYLATRGPSGWSSEDLIPLQSYDGDRCAQPETGGDLIWAYSTDLSQGVLGVGAEENFGESEFKGGCGAEGLEVLSGEPLGVQNLLLRGNITGSYRLINVPPSEAIPTNAHFQGASADLGHVIFSENARLTPDAPTGVEDLFDWDKGTLGLVTVLPDGTPAVGALAADWTHHPRVISADGSRVFFTAGGNLYVRINGKETVQLDEARGGSGPGGGGAFQDASADGSQAYFTDDASAGLTSDTAPGSGMNLYRYSAGQLTDLTSAEHAEVKQLLGVSNEGSYAYFMAAGVLPGSQTNQRGEMAQAGRPNLYLWHGGATAFIATLSAKEAGSLTGGIRVSADGAFLAFSSEGSLTGYDNTDGATRNSDPEIFLYEAASGVLSCASCDPSGAPPTAGGAVMPEEEAGSPHSLSSGGRLFFQTNEGLLPRDTNSKTDVYEYEQGQLQLISSGTSRDQSLLIDASESGNDVFFLSRQSLVAQDSATEALIVYDARVDGGFPVSVSPPPCTTADACRAPVSAQPSLFGAPSSQTFSGVGNLSASASSRNFLKPRSLTRGQKLARTLKACHKQKNRRKRATCERRATKRYGGKASALKRSGLVNESKRGSK